MTEAQEVRARAKALRERREELEKALAGAAGPGAQRLLRRLQLVEVGHQPLLQLLQPTHLRPGSHRQRSQPLQPAPDGAEHRGVVYPQQPSDLPQAQPLPIV